MTSLAGVAAVGALIVGLYVVRESSGHIPIPLVVALPVPLLVPILGGYISKVVPGTKARGLFKGSLLGYVGWFVGALAVILINGYTIPTIPITLAWAIDQGLEGLLGTIALRSVLLLFE